MQIIPRNQKEGSGGAGRDRGFTLVEVLFALLITGILLGAALKFFYGEWQISQTLKDKMEAHYAVVTAGRWVSDAIREAESVQWTNRGKWTLAITPSGENYSDQYYLDDKDYDGVKDLYRYHKGAHNPLVSGIVDWNCTQGVSGLWTITFQGQIGKQKVYWQSRIRARSGVN